MAAVPLLGYAAWEGYWYTRVGLCMVKWHTHLAVYVYLWVAGLAAYIWRWRKNPAPGRGNWFVAFSAVVFMLGLFELVLIVWGRQKTYLEQITGAYGSLYKPNVQSAYFAWPRTDTFHLIEKPEYTYWRPTNQHGFGDTRWSLAADNGTLRVLTLGDSFTEGDGAAFDSSYPAVLRQLLQQTQPGAQVLNGGMLGSDPFYNFKWLRDSLYSYKPQVVIQTLSSNDFTIDYALRGGAERFKPDGTVQYRPAPWWEPLFALNYTVRYGFHMAGYSDQLIPEKFSPRQTADMNRAFSMWFTQYAAFCRKHNIQLYVVVFPGKSEIEQQAYAFNLQATVRHLQHTPGVQVLDLLPQYVQYMRQPGHNLNDYYWKKDGHHNARGYAVMANFVYQRTFAPAR